MKRLVLLPPITLAASSLLLVACGGGGSSSVRPGTTFTSWADINPPQTVTASGLSAESTYSAPEPDSLVTELGNTQESETTKATLTYDANGNLTRVRISTGFSAVTWDKANEDIIEVVDRDIVLAKESAVGIVSDPFTEGWNYQTFGTWITGFDNGSGRAGAFSIGAPTPNIRIPINGSASFSGKTLGTYIDPDGEAFLTDSDMAVDADFLRRELKFSTTDTDKISLVADLPVRSDADNLNLTGTLNYSLGDSTFSGAVSATGLDGTAKGQFYGPDAQEIGGYFNLRGAGVEAYRGAFGGKDPLR